MKSTLFIVFISMILALPGCAAKTASENAEIKDLVRNMPADQRTSLQADFLAQALSLTPEQSLQIDQINKKYARHVDSILLSDDWRSRKAKRFKAAMKKKDRELKKVFTKEQYKKYQQIKEEIKQNLRNKR